MFSKLPVFFLFFFICYSGISQQLIINEILASNSKVNADEDGDFEDWVEVYNAGNEVVNLAGFGLSDNDSQPYKWEFPSVQLQPNEFVLVWASGKNKTNPNSELHTNFSISSGGEPISLTNAEGELLDYVDAIALPTDVSYGRGVGDESEVFFYFYEPTPGTANTTTTFDALLEAPSFSHSSGFYEDAFELTISTNSTNEGETIYYTLDGSEPTPENVGGKTFQYKNQYPQFPGQQTGAFLENTYETLVYQGGILIEDRNNQPNKLANITTTKSFTNNNQPSNEVRKATVVKSRIVKDGVNGPITTNTYFVSDENVFDTNLPILSISLDDSSLFDYEDGIYVAGIDFDSWRANHPNSPYSFHNPANYRRRGRETEKLSSFQWFESGNLVYERQIGLRLHGGASRSRAMKSLRLYARNEYDNTNSFDHAVFGEGNDSSFRRLILRNSGNDSYYTMLRDAYLQRLVRHLNFDTQDYRPVVHYLNGEYWGLINLRERYDRHYFERVYGIEEGDLDFLDSSGLNETTIQEGDNLHWVDLYTFIAENDVSSQSNYLFINTQMDVTNFIDYQLANIYFRNTDWPGNNIAFFRKKTASFQEGAPYGHDGRWRWVMYDTDFGFGHAQSEGEEAHEHNTLAFATQTGGTGWPNPDWSTLVLRKLLTNDNFKNQFINRYADMINTTFLPERIIPILTEMKTAIEDEIPYVQERWNANSNWEGQINSIVYFGNNRSAFARNHIQTHFELNGQHQITLNVSDEEHGSILINTIAINEQTPGVSESPYPWSGTYFEGIPVTLSPVPKTGYIFSHWSGDVETMQEEIQVNLTSNMSITAHFEEGEPTDEILYFWVMDNDMPNNTPLESLAATYTNTAITNGEATLLYTSSLLGYPFNSNHPNWRVASMERRNRPTSINYLPQANNDVPFEEANMRGLQIREMFQTEEAENILTIQANTTEYQDIQLAFAVMDEDAVEGLVIEYLNDANQWTNAGLTNTSIPVFDAYNLVEVDFSSTEEANNNDNFQMRIRFEGQNLDENNGNRITFNNISIKGSQVLSTEIPNEEEVLIYPNPVNNILFVQGTQANASYEIYTLQGKIIQRGVIQSNKINTEELYRGFYLLVINENNRRNRFKLIKN